MFCSERGGPLTAKGWNTLFGRIGDRGDMPFHVHPHMLRHGCGFKLANEGQDTRAIQAFLGHARIESTTIYTALLFRVLRRDGLLRRFNLRTLRSLIKKP